MTFPKVGSFLRKYGQEHNENGVKALFRLSRYEDGKWYSDSNGGNKTNLRENTASGGADNMISTMEKLGMVTKKADMPF